MPEIFFSEQNQEAFPLVEASDLALVWLAAKVVNERLSLSIQGDYEWLSVLSDSHWDCIGNPLNWAPLDRVEPVVMGEIFSRGISLVADGESWVAYSSSEPGRRFSDSSPLRASCMALVYDAFGDRVCAPVQLQRYEELRDGLREQRARERADEAQRAHEESLWAYEPR